MREIYEDPKTGRCKWREKQSVSEPPVRVQRFVVLRLIASASMVSAAGLLSGDGNPGAQLLICASAWLVVAGFFIFNP